MVMETVGKIEILFIIHSAQVLVFPSFFLSSLLKITSRAASRLIFSFRSSRQCIPCTYNNNTNNRSENIYVFTSKHFTARRKAGRSFTCLLRHRENSWDYVQASLEITLGKTFHFYTIFNFKGTFVNSIFYNLCSVTARDIEEQKSRSFGRW